MAKLFGVDIQKEIANAFKGQLLPLTLTKYTPGTATAGALTAGTNRTPVPSSGEGFVEPIDMRSQGTLVKGATAQVSIIGGSLPAGVVPGAGDDVLIDGTKYEILDSSTDPAKALYECQVAG